MNISHWWSWVWLLQFLKLMKLTVLNMDGMWKKRVMYDPYKE